MYNLYVSLVGWLFGWVAYGVVHWIDIQHIVVICVLYLSACTSPLKLPYLINANLILNFKFKNCPGILLQVCEGYTVVGMELKVGKLSGFVGFCAVSYDVCTFRYIQHLSYDAKTRMGEISFTPPKHTFPTLQS